MSGIWKICVQNVTDKKDIFVQCDRYKDLCGHIVKNMKDISINFLDRTEAEIQVQHNIENVAANEANLEAKIEKKKVSTEHWSPEGEVAVIFTSLQKK